MKTSVRVTLTVIAGGAIAGCHHRQADPVYTAPATQTVTTTTTSVSTTDTTTRYPAMATAASTERREERTAVSEARAERREVRLAMASLERARRELEHAGHDFGGRKGDAMKASDAALRELRLANGQEMREARAGAETMAERRTEGRELHMALVDLERARADMEHATHNFSGRRKETLEAVDAAIREIRLAAEYEK